MEQNNSLINWNEADFESKSAICVNSEYWQPSVNDSIVGIYLGIDSIVIDDTIMDAVKIVTKNGIYLSAASMLVSTLKNIPANTPVRITYLGVKKTRKNFSLSSFKIEVLC